MGQVSDTFVSVFDSFNKPVGLEKDSAWTAFAMPHQLFSKGVLSIPAQDFASQFHILKFHVDFDEPSCSLEHSFSNPLLSPM